MIAAGLGRASYYTSEKDGVSAGWLLMVLSGAPLREARLSLWRSFEATASHSECRDDGVGFRMRL